MAGIINALTGYGGVEGLIAGPNISITGTTDFPIVSATGTPSGVSSVTGDPPYIVIGGTPSNPIITAPLLAFQPQYTFYVAMNGNDVTGDGSANNPYQTIGKALTERAGLPNTVEIAIQVFDGTYNENIAITTNNTYLVGTTTGNVRQPGNINGTVTIAITSGTGSLNVAIANFTIIGNFVISCNTTPDLSGVIALNQLNFTNTSGLVGIQISDTETTLHQIVVQDCRLNVGNGNTVCIQCLGGALQMINTILTNVGTGVTIASLNDAFVTIRYCTITNTNTSTSNSPLIEFNNTTTPPTTSEITQSTIRYLSTSTDVGGGKCCIRFSNTVAVTVFLADCILRCAGAITGTPPQCIQRTGAGAVNLTYGGLTTDASAQAINSTITRTPLQQSNQGVYASFSSSLTQNVTGSNTPTTITHNTTDFVSYALSLSAGSIRIARAGIYEVIPSIQFDKSAGLAAIIYFWLRVNGTDVPDSCTSIVVSGFNASTVGTVSFITSLNANDLLSVVFASSDTTCRVLALPTQTLPYVRPAIPSIITTVKLLT